MWLTKNGRGHAHLKIPRLIAGMVAGADSIDDLVALRHGRMDRCLKTVPAKTGPGSYLFGRPVILDRYRNY
ncbi:MAG: hypothetical protein QOF39_130 [Frankiales bacterium]|nr:hypothetical protein [Frankiales bacterium]